MLTWILVIYAILTVMRSVWVENVSVGAMNISDILRHCECGICDHNNESDCIGQECACCYNFHIRARTDLNNGQKE